MCTASLLPSVCMYVPLFPSALFFFRSFHTYSVYLPYLYPYRLHKGETPPLQYGCQQQQQPISSGEAAKGLLESVRYPLVYNQQTSSVFRVLRCVCVCGWCDFVLREYIR